MEMETFRGQIKTPLHESDDFERRLALAAFEAVTSIIEIADHLEHERAGITVAVVAGGAGRSLIPVAPGPDRAVRRNRDVLGNVTPLVGFRVVVPHAFDSGQSFVVAVTRLPRMMHMHRID